MAALIAAQRDAHGIPAALACRALGVSRSWSCKHEDAVLPPQAARREQLKAEVRRAERLSDQFPGVEFGTVPNLPAVDSSSPPPGADPGAGAFTGTTKTTTCGDVTNSQP